MTFDFFALKYTITKQIEKNVLPTLLIKLNYMKKEYLVKIYKQDYNNEGISILMRTSDWYFDSKKEAFKIARYEIAEYAKEFFLNYNGDFRDKCWGQAVITYKNLMQGNEINFENDRIVYWFKVFSRKIKN